MAHHSVIPDRSIIQDRSIRSIPLDHGIPLSALRREFNPITIKRQTRDSIEWKSDAEILSDIFRGGKLPKGWTGLPKKVE